MIARKRKNVSETYEFVLSYTIRLKMPRKILGSPELSHYPLAFFSSFVDSLVSELSVLVELAQPPD